MEAIKIKSYAKVNLFLNCLRQRVDGFHEIESILQAINLYDQIKIVPHQDLKITTNHPLVPTDRQNLAFQAAEILLQKFPHLPGAHIEIDKAIPIEAGLGGGSSNAASVLLGMNQLFKLGLTKEEMMNMADGIGSDVPFFFLGPTALAKGRGEKLTELSPTGFFWLVLAKPSLGVRTRDVYQNLDLANKKPGPHIEEFCQALQTNQPEYLEGRLYNTLEQSTFQLYPQVWALKEKIKSLGGQNVLMSGSGPTMFVLLATEAEAHALCGELKKELKSESVQVLVTSTVSEKTYKERIGSDAL